MMRWSTVIWLVLAIVAGTGLFVVKHEVRALEGRLAKLNHQLVREQESVHVLNAEWPYLNRPERLEELGMRLLHLQPLRAAQTITINQLLARLDTAAQAAAASDRASVDSPRTGAGSRRIAARVRKSR